MENGKVKATVIKCIAAVLCTAITAGAGIMNTDKICKNNLEISGGSAGKAAVVADNTNSEFEAMFEDDGLQGQTGDEDPAEDSSATEDYGQGESASGTAAAQSGTKQTVKKNTAKKEITLTGGLSSTNKEEILEYYKLVSKKNSKLLFTKTLTLISMDGGKNISQKMIDIFTPIAQKALAKNTITDEPYPGRPDKIKASDWQAAKAVNDGTYTTVYIKVVPQTDSYNGSEFEGTCGRTMGVLDGIDRALQEMNMISVDFSNTKMTIQYQNPIVKLKVKNATGELVKGGCEWSYRTYPYIESMNAKFLAINIHLEGAGGYIDYSVKY